jgi:hypothetical protein
LSALAWPEEAHRVVIGNAGVVRERIPSVAVPGGSRTTLGEGEMIAASHRYEAGATSGIMSDAGQTTCLHIAHGSGQVLLGTADELRRVSPPAIAVKAGNLLLIPPGAHYAFVNDGASAMGVAEHRIDASTAFVRG